jgi:uncharacterized membrane protein YjgN (DUF898 family)
MLAILLRIFFAAVLVPSTFNPTRHSYVHWIGDNFPQVTPLQAVAGVAVLIGWVVHLRATLRSLGALGVLLMLALLAAVVWLLVSWNWIRFEQAGALEWVVLTIISIVLGIGMSWSHIRRRLSGQADVSDVDRR